ncbi:MAG: type II toxin-antitoxin system RelE/ParE family toxin [Methanoregula sp.]
MVKVAYGPGFEKTIRKIHDHSLKERIKTPLIKIIENPEAGKPMRYCKKGTREVYIPPFRVSYMYTKQHDPLVFLALYHKNEQ